MTFRTLLDKPITTCVVCWPEEENKLSVVPAKKIISPGPDDFESGKFCKIQGLESHPCKIVAMGTVEEMIMKIRQLEAGEDTEGSQSPRGDATEEPPPKKKAGVEKASKKQKPITTCVVCWPEEENKLSLVSAKKIVSPAQEDFAPDTFCKVKGFESHLCKMVAVGTEADMKKKIKELEAGDDAEEAPPKKKPCVEKAPKGRKRLGKENRNKPPSQPKKKEGKKGSIILVAAQQLGNTTSAIPSQPTALLQENTNVTSATPNQSTAPSTPLKENTNTTPFAASQPTASHQENTDTASAASSQSTAPSTLPQENTNATSAAHSQSTAPSTRLHENTNATSAALSQSTALSTSSLQENTNAASAAPSQSTALLQNTNTTSAAPSESMLDETHNPHNQCLTDEEETRSNYENHDVHVDNDQDPSLMLSLTVDDHSQRLEKLEGTLARMEMLDAEKTKRIQELELTVSRLLSYTLSCSQQPAVLLQGPPPKGLPPSPLSAAPVTPQPHRRRPPHQSLEAGPSAILNFTPQPPQHLPPTLQETPPPSRRPPPPSSGVDNPATLGFTPQPPSYLPPTLQATPPPPRHRPPPLFPSPGAGPSASLHPVAPGQKRRAPMSSVGKLPSSSIDKSALFSVNSVVQANLDLLGQEAKIPIMARILARDAYFGEQVMAQCTAQGYGDKPGLPAAEMRELKHEVRKLYPNFLNNSLIFEEKWTKCQESISQACKRARAKLRKK